MTGNLLYRIWYGSRLVYIGRTRQELRERIRGHFFAKPMHRNVDIFSTTRVDYAEFQTMADMYLYEVYFINKHHPPLNMDDKASDDLTVELPQVEWRDFELHLLEKWRGQLTGSREYTRVRRWTEQYFREHPGYAEMEEVEEPTCT